MPSLHSTARALSVVGARVAAAASQRRIERDLAARRAVPGREYAFAVYFADGPSSSYQLEQWLRPLEALDDAAGRVALLVRNPFVARRVAARTHLPIEPADTSDRVEAFVAARGVKVLFYVNNSQANFTILRINGPAHIHLSHGESEKVSMVSHQLKAYDFAFIAGNAARERILARVPRIDPEALVEIGRPQLDLGSTPVPRWKASGRTTVLYAPTWEGDSRQMAYGSLLSHGGPLVGALLADDRFQLVFRPHPKTGTLSGAYRQALARLRRMVAEAARKGGGHLVDEADAPVASIAAADVVVSDVSAMAMDALGLDKPLVLCGSTPGAARGLEAVATHWPERVPVDAADILLELASAGASAAQRAYKVQVFGEGTPAAATGRFVRAARRIAGTS